LPVALARCAKHHFVTISRRLTQAPGREVARLATDRAAQAVHRSLKEVLPAVLDGVLPSRNDVLTKMPPELIELTWLDAWLSVANTATSDEGQRDWST
jgi:hypothetical protein